MSNGAVIKFKIVVLACILLAPFIAVGVSPAASAEVAKCQKYNFAELFYADYRTGTHWDNSSGALRITWSAQASTINDEVAARAFTEKERAWLRVAFQSWDKALDTVTFVEVGASENPDVVIGFVDLKPQNVQPGAYGFWTAWSSDGIRNKATVKLKVSGTQWFSRRNQFIHSVQHELGNVLGLGDIVPTKAFESVFEDPWQPPFGRSTLSVTDVSMMKQLYGEPVSCA